MKPTHALCILVLSIATSTTGAAEKEIPNRLIDYQGFLSDAAKVQEVRELRRISESDFIKMASDPSTIVLDARSREKFLLLHMTGARHLSLPDFTAEELAQIIPDKSTRILIYCNNNFEKEPEAFPAKMARASLNIYTFNTLYSYGYRNIYELGPLIDITKTRLNLEGSLRNSAQRSEARR